MKLTGKAKDDFTKWKVTNDYIYVTTYSKSYNILENSLIIEWFDNVGVIIHTSYDIVDKKWGYEIFNDFIYNNNDDDFYIPMIHNMFNTRQEAISKAIIKANDIYNETKV